MMKNEYIFIGFDPKDLVVGAVGSYEGNGGFALEARGEGESSYEEDTHSSIGWIAPWDSFIVGRRRQG